jgi:hypothetical protein
MIKLWRPERTNWVDCIIQSNCDQVEIVQDLEQIKTDAESMTVVVDVFQNNVSCTIEEILEYNKLFDRIVLINCETRPDLLKIVQQFDLAKVHFVNIGHLNYVPHSMKIIGVETFIGEIRKLYHRTDYTALKDLEPFKPKNFYFDALLGNPKKHRDLVYQKIQDHGEDKFFVRRQQPKESLEHLLKNNSWHWPDGAVIIPETNQIHWQTSTQIQFSGTTTNVSNVVPVDIYNDTCYSIVTETIHISDYVMLTEKTAKPLIAKRLFVMFAGSGYLAHLHRLGFQTFDSVIDESYDLELNDTTRWTRAFEQVEYLCSQPQEIILQKIQPILEHNYNLFVSRDWNKEYEQAIVTAVTFT